MKKQILKNKIYGMGTKKIKSKNIFALKYLISKIHVYIEFSTTTTTRNKKYKNNFQL